ncbi:MAG: DUF2200 domain-containing protein [Flavobacteriales bacterium]
MKPTSNNERVFRMSFASVYPHYVNKVERKGRTVEELHTVIRWLTGYTEKGLAKVIADETDFETFFAKAPRMHANAHLITGMICGYRIEEIEDPIMRQVRYMDKLVDELAKGRAMEKIMRK